MQQRELGINFCGDVALEFIRRCASAACEAGFTHLWAGEVRRELHPFVLLPLLAHASESATVGTCIVSALANPCSRIREAFAELRSAYGDRFIAGIAPGDLRSLRQEGVSAAGVLKRMRACISMLAPELPVYLGASGPKMIELGSALAEGVLLNYGNPEHFRWALGHAKGNARLLSVAPALLLPDSRNLGELRGACAVVAAGASRAFAEDAGIEREVAEVAALVERRRWSMLRRYERFLLENFAISGTLEEIAERVEELRRLGAEQVVLAPPFFKGGEKVIKRVGERLCACSL
ncbi:MAG: LLM class flavin-dependent oxidoreductase [Euryarchaeota archaeon]|nr:LLM class flavin-dependent oxidoreductase [Euryarchaeota archaeon]